MADISKEIQNFKEADYGEDVRDSLISLTEKVNAEGEQALATVETQTQDVAAAVQTANTTSQVATEAVQRAHNTIDVADQTLAGATAQAGLSAASATLSESWAVGGTGSREGEDDNNSKAHADRAKTEADRSTTEADRAAQYANIVAPGFYVDPVTMTLYMKAGVGVDFVVADDNVLCRKVS